jgi:cytochrome b561
MAMRNDAAAWGWPARLLHWLIALLVIGVWVLGKVMVDVPDEELARKFQLYQLHKSIGVTVFALALLRLAWRLANPVPDMPAGMRAWERHAARVTHALFYLLLVAIPITGYLTAAASPLGIPTVIFGVIPLPHAIGPDEATESLLGEVHEALGTLLAVLLILHVLAALKHHFVDRDPVLRRMVRG